MTQLLESQIDRYLTDMGDRYIHLSNNRNLMEAEAVEKKAMDLVECLERGGDILTLPRLADLLL
jgi:hypothetical protein